MGEGRGELQSWGAGELLCLIGNEEAFLKKQGGAGSVVCPGVLVRGGWCERRKVVLRGNVM